MVEDLAGNEVVRMLLRKKDAIRYLRHDSTFSGHVPQLGSNYLHFYVGRGANIFAIGRDYYRGHVDRLYILSKGEHGSAFSEWDYLPVSDHLVDTLLPYVKAKQDQRDREDREATYARALRA